MSLTILFVKEASFIRLSHDDSLKLSNQSRFTDHNIVIESKLIFFIFWLTSVPSYCALFQITFWVIKYDVEAKHEEKLGTFFLKFSLCLGGHTLKLRYSYSWMLSFIDPIIIRPGCNLKS